MVVADLWCGERVNPGFEECRGRNLEMFFLKPSEFSSFIPKVKEIAGDVEFVAVPGCLVERVRLLLIPVLKKCRVAATTYYHSPRVELLERSKRALEKYGIKVSAYFLPTYNPERGIILRNGEEEFVDVIPVSPFGDLFGDVGEFGEVGKANLSPSSRNLIRVLEILAKTERYSRYYRRDIWERFMNTEYTFSAAVNFETFLEIVSCYQQRCARWMKSKLSAMAMRTLPVRLGFHFSAGVAIDLEEFCEMVEKIDEGELKEYLRRGDFSKWIGEVLRDKRLAKEIDACKTREEVLKTVKKRMKEYAL